MAANLLDAEKAIRTRNYELAFSLYKEAAIAGEAEAQYQLANLYRLGKGVSKNDEEALNWMQRAAANAHPAAQYNLALMQMRDNPDYAISLLQNSANKGYSPALNYLKKMSIAPETEIQDANNNLQLWFGLGRRNAIVDMKRLVNAGQHIDQMDETGRTVLFTAVESGSEAVIEWLLTQGADPDHRDLFGNTPAFIATAQDNSTVLQQLLDAGASVSQTLPNGDNLLHFSIRNKNFAMVPLLISKGVPVNQVNNDAWTPLDLADYTENKSVIASLIAAGAINGKAWVSNDGKLKNKVAAENILKESNSSNLALQDLAKVIINGNLTLARELTRKRPELLTRRLSDGSTLLSVAIKQSNPDMVAILLHAGANPNQEMNAGTTPLHMAVVGTSLKSMELLLDAGADPLIEDENGFDVLGLAIMQGQLSIAESLLNRLLSNNQINKTMLPIDHYILLAAQADKDNIVRSLLPFYNTVIDDDLGRNALWYAVHNKNADLVAELVKNGFPVYSDQQGGNPFYTSVEVDCLLCMEQLLLVSDINQQTPNGTTALMSAARNGNIEITQWLLAQNADIDIRNEQGNTALIFAVQAGAIEVVKLLMEAGAKPSRKNKLGLSAIDIAKEQNPEIHSMLKNRSLLGIFN